MGQGTPSLQGDFALPKDARFAIVAARFNELIVEPLLDGALAMRRRHGVAEANIVVVRVPGAFEVPLACQRIAASGKVKAVIALGCVIRGGTPHCDYVASAVGRISALWGVPWTGGRGTTSENRRSVSSVRLKVEQHQLVSGDGGIRLGSIGLQGA